MNGVLPAGGNRYTSAPPHTLVCPQFSILLAVWVDMPRGITDLGKPPVLRMLYGTARVRSALQIMVMVGQSYSLVVREN